MDCRLEKIQREIDETCINAGSTPIDWQRFHVREIDGITYITDYRLTARWWPEYAAEVVRKLRQS